MQVSPKADRSKNLDFSTRFLGSNASRGSLESGREPATSFASSSSDNNDFGPDSGQDLPLKDMIVYPEIYSNDTNISETSHGYLEKLGAKIEKRLNKKCNVIIWKDGSIKTIEKAREYGIPIVNSLWLEDCVENFHLADLKKYAKNLPTETEMPFLALQETKKRKALEAVNEEESGFGGIPPELMKRSLKKNKRNSFEDEDPGERIPLRFDSLKDDADKKKEGRTLRRSQTAKPSVGSWLLTFNENSRPDKKESSNKDSKSTTKEKSSKDRLSGDTNLNIESMFNKKKEEENSAKVRSMILGYARPGSLGTLDEEVDDNWKKSSTKDKSDVSSTHSKESEKYNTKSKWQSKDDDSDENSNSREKAKSSMSMHKSFSMGESRHSPVAEDETTFTFKTRVMLREERRNFENDRLQEKSFDKNTNSFDIGITAREELMKKEGSNFGKISAIWSKYTGKTDPRAAEKEEQKSIGTDEKKNVSNKMQVEEKISKKASESRGLGERRVSTRRNNSKLKELSEDEESDSDDDLVVNRRTRISKESLSKKSSKDDSALKKIDEKKTPIQMSKSLKLETPARRTSSTTALEQTTDTTKGSRSDQKSDFSGEKKTPLTKESLTKSSFISKYLGSASSNTSAQESEGISGLRNNGVRNLRSGFASEAKKKPEREDSEEENEKTQRSKEAKEEEMMKKTIKKKTGDKKKEEYVLFSGLKGKDLGKVEEFCRKFGLKLLEDELRNLQRADFLIYEGVEAPKSYRVAFTMLRGKSIVNRDWLDESLQKGRLLDYKDYEYCYSIEVRKKLLAGLRFFIDKDFEGLTGNMVLKKDLVNLLEEANGKILDNVRSSDFCVMKKMNKKPSDIPAHVKIITSQWIIDSIIEGKLLSTDEVNYSF